MSTTMAGTKIGRALAERERKRGSYHCPTEDRYYYSYKRAAAVFLFRGSFSLSRFFYSSLLWRLCPISLILLLLLLLLLLSLYLWASVRGGMRDEVPQGHLNENAANDDEPTAPLSRIEILPENEQPFFFYIMYYWASNSRFEMACLRLDRDEENYLNFYFVIKIFFYFFFLRHG